MGRKEGTRSVWVHGAIIEKCKPSNPHLALTVGAASATGSASGIASFFPNNIKEQANRKGSVSMMTRNFGKIAEDGSWEFQENVYLQAQGPPKHCEEEKCNRLVRMLYEEWIDRMNGKEAHRSLHGRLSLSDSFSLGIPLPGLRSQKTKGTSDVSDRLM